MVEFGDEFNFTIDSYRIPWLIWIQLLVMILLVLLLYFGLAVFDSDTLSTTTSSAAAPPSTQLDKPSSSHGHAGIKVENHRNRSDVGTSRIAIRDENEIEEDSSIKGSMCLARHPCNYIGLVRRVFLKCLGLDSSSEICSNPQRDKQE